VTLPDGWVTTTLAECQARSKTLNPLFFKNEEFDLYSVPSYSRYQPERAHGHEIGSTKQEVQEGDVLLCKIVPHIRRGWVVPPATNRRQIASGEWIIFRDTGIEPKYLRRFILSDEFHDQFMLTVSGVGGSLMRARPSEAGLIEVPVPPLAEQRRIVAKLDALTARLARARAELDRVPVLARHLRQTAMTACYEQAVGSLIPFGNLLKGIESGKNLRCEERPPRQGEQGVIKVSAVTWGRFDPSKSKTLPSDYSPPEKARINQGDLLISRANTLELVGAPVLVEEQPIALFLSDKVLRLIVSDEDKRWVLWFLRSPAGRGQIENLATGNQLSMRNISQDALRRVELPYPNAEYRKTAITALEAAFTRADRLEAEAARARALLDRLESAILARAFRGELVPQNPADEPASALLARIRQSRAAAPSGARRGRKAKAG
jgi:type I restriction enzyme, S subunit